MEDKTNKEMAADMMRMDPQKGVFIEKLLEEKMKSPINSNPLTTQQLQSIAWELKCRTGSLYNVTYLRGKYYRLRTDWKHYRELLHNNTRVGIDPVNGAILGSDQHGRTGYLNGLAHYNELTLLFGTSTATGDYGRHAGMTHTNLNEEKRIEEFRGLHPFSTNARIDDGIFDYGVSQSEQCAYSRKSRKRPLDASGGSSGGDSSKKTRSSSIEAALDAWQTRQVNLAAKSEDEVTITECMKVITEMNLDDDLYMKANQYLCDPANRVIFKMSTPDKRVLIFEFAPLIIHLPLLVFWHL